MQQLAAIEAVPDTALTERTSVLNTQLPTHVLAKETNLTFTHVSSVSMRSACDVVVQRHAVDLIAQHLLAKVHDGSRAKRIRQNGHSEKRLAT